MTKKLHIGMSLAPTWLSNDAWRLGDSNIENVFTGDYFVEIARRAEAAKLDFVFRPDSLFLNSQVLEATPGFASLDPTVLLAALARETSKIGLLSTISTMFTPPYIVARQIMSLHWLSNGRAGWNIVTALDGNQNFGLEEMPSSADRYRRAAESTAIVQKLWRSFPEKALLRDRETGHYASSELIAPISHQGEHFSVEGPLNLPSFDRASIPLIQAGASEAGRAFATSVAHAIFSATPDMAAAVALRQDLRQRAVNHGRKADDIRLLPGLSLYLAPTRGEARDLFSFTHARTDRQRKIAHVARLTGLDISQWPDDRKVKGEDLPELLPVGASQTHAGLLFRLIRNEEPSVADLLMRPEVIGAGHWQIIGTPDDALEEIRTWTDAGAIDGFITAPGGGAASMGLALDELMPRLSEAGLLRSEYAGSTFASHLLED